jgi:hypothetical protein
MLKSKSNTLFVGYQDQFHIHAGVCKATPMGLTLRNSFASKDLKGEVWAIRFAERAGLAPIRAMVTQCVLSQPSVS